MDFWRLWRHLCVCGWLSVSYLSDYSAKSICLVYTHVKLYFANRSGWNKLQEMIQFREKKLAHYHEIHRFNRDAGEILGRVKVKFESNSLVNRIHWMYSERGHVNNNILRSHGKISTLSPFTQCHSCL